MIFSFICFYNLFINFIFLQFKMFYFSMSHINIIPFPAVLCQVLSTRTRCTTETCHALGTKTPSKTSLRTLCTFNCTGQPKAFPPLLCSPFYYFTLPFYYLTTLIDTVCPLYLRRFRYFHQSESYKCVLLLSFEIMHL